MLKLLDFVVFSTFVITSVIPITLGLPLFVENKQLKEDIHTLKFPFRAKPTKTDRVK